MAKVPSKTTGELKWGAAKSWTPEGEPGAGDDVEFPAGSEVNMVVNVTAKCRSVFQAAGFLGKLTGKTKQAIEVGNSEAPSSGYAWKMVAGGFTAEVAFIVRFHSTYKGAQQKTVTAANAFKEVQSGGAGVTEALYLLEDDFKALETGTQSILWDGGTWDWNGHNVEAWGFETGASKIKPRAGTLTLTGASATVPILKVEAATEWEGGECAITFTDTTTTQKRITSEGSNRVLAAVLTLTNAVYFNSTSSPEVKVGELRVNTAPGVTGITFDGQYVVRVTKAMSVNSTETAHRVLMKLQSGSAEEALAWRLVNETGKPIGIDYVELQGSKAEGESCYAGTHSVQGTNVHNWKFEYPPGTFVQSVSKATNASVGGEVTQAISPASGDYLMIAVNTPLAAGGATAVTDNKGNTYTLDTEIRTGAFPTLQHWRGKVGSGVTEIKLTGFVSMMGVNLVVIEVTPISSLDTLGSKTGTGTTIEVTTEASLKSGKHFAVAWFGSATVSTFTIGSGFINIPGATQTGMDLAGGYTETPTPSVALTAKGTFETSAAYSTTVIAYRVGEATTAAGITKLVFSDTGKAVLTQRGSGSAKIVLASNTSVGVADAVGGKTRASFTTISLPTQLQLTSGKTNLRLSDQGGLANNQSVAGKAFLSLSSKANSRLIQNIAAKTVLFLIAKAQSSNIAKATGTTARLTLTTIASAIGGSEAVAAGTSLLRFTAKAGAVVKSTTQSKIKLVLSSQPNPAMKSTVGGKSSILFGAKGGLSIRVGIQAISSVIFSARGKSLATTIIQATTKIVLKGQAVTHHTIKRLVILFTGLVNPKSKFGQSEVSSRRGQSNPRLAHLIDKEIKPN